MGNISDIFGGPWTPPGEEVSKSPFDQLADAMRAAGITPPDIFYFDGLIHRFDSGTKGTPGHGDKTGWYVVYDDGICAGAFGCWRSGVQSNWREDLRRDISPAEEMEITRLQLAARTKNEEERQRRRDSVANTVNSIWKSAVLATPDHPYLTKKQISPHGARVTGGGRLIVPLRTPDGRITSLQYIDNDGKKSFHPGGMVGGCTWTIGSAEDPGPIYIAEGFATAASIHEVTSKLCVVAYSAGNLTNAAKTIREQYGPLQEIVIVADNDESGVGEREATKAAEAYGARVVLIPTVGMDANDYLVSGGDLAGLLSPKDKGWLIPVDEFSKQPAPISWLIKRWVPDKTLCMIHGPSGGGKTFCVLDMCLSIASGADDWFGNRVKKGNVIYLAGEGHHGLRGRIAAWKIHNNVTGNLDMWVSKTGCNLNTSTGYAQVREAVSQIGTNPDLIVIDTLHRFLSGDENSAQDTKTMLDVCAALMDEYQCTIIFVHHTGVSDEAQHRARGSSAWRGALDIEISVIPANGNNPIQIVQRKAKDSEITDPLYAELVKVTIPGWMDEDNAPVTSAVIAEVDAPPDKPKGESKIASHIKVFENAWRASGCETRDGKPYVTRSALAYKLESDGRKARTIRNDLNPSYGDRLIGMLINAEIIKRYDDGGWIVCNDVQASAMMMQH